MSTHIHAISTWEDRCLWVSCQHQIRINNYMHGLITGKHYSCILGLYSLSGKTSYRKISWSLKAARFGFKLVQSLWNLAGTSAALLPRCLSNFRAMRPLQHTISRLWDFTRFDGKTSYRLVNRGPVVHVSVINRMSDLSLILEQKVPSISVSFMRTTMTISKRSFAVVIISWNNIWLDFDIFANKNWHCKDREHLLI